MWEGVGVIWALLGMLATGVFWIILAAVVIKLVKSRPGSTPAPPSALRILEERYARGEISREEFAERRDVLTGHGGRPGAPPPTT